MTFDTHATADASTTFSRQTGTNFSITAKSYDTYIMEGRARAEQEYIDQLKAEGKAVYSNEEVCQALGIKNDPTWTQKDLQTHMAVDPVMVPVRNLQAKATEINTLYVKPGRDAWKSLMQEVYGNYIKAVTSDHKEKLYSLLTGEWSKKLQNDMPLANVLVKAVFKDCDLDYKQVHVYSKALEYAYFKNTAADEFVALVDCSNGFEGIRKLAMESLPKTPAQIQAAKERADERDAHAEVLAKVWALKRQHSSLRLPLPKAHAFDGNHTYELLCVVEGDELVMLKAVRHHPQAVVDPMRNWNEGVLANAAHAGGDPKKDGFTVLCGVLRDIEEGANDAYVDLQTQTVVGW